MPATLAPSPDDIEMSSVFGALRKALPKLVLWSLALGGLTFGALTTIAPKYQSQAEMQISAKGSGGTLADPSAATADSVAVKMDKEAINTHVRALQSDDLLAAVADDLALKDKREFNAANGPVDTFDMLTRMVGLGGPRADESERDRVMSTLKRQLDIFAAKDARTIAVRQTAIEPQLAADIANKIAEKYQKSLASAATQAVDDQQNLLEERIAKLQGEVAAAETEVDRYRGEINVFKGGAQNTGLNEQQLSDLTAELSKAKAARSEADARAKSAREMMKAGTADALPDVQKSPLIQNLVQQRVRIERQISELSATLLPGHPRMQQLNADLAGLKRQLTGEIGKLVDSLEKETKVAAGREEAIKKSIDEIKHKVVDKAPEEAKLRQLELEARTKRTELETLKSQLEGNRKRLDTRAQSAEVLIIARAQPSSLPVSPKKGQTAALIAFATLLFGTFLTVTKALFSGARGAVASEPKLKSDKLRKEPELPALETQKGATAARTAAKASLLGDTQSPQLRAAAQRLRKAAPEHGGHRAIVTGEMAAIDASDEAIALARSLSQSGGHVVLINWNTKGEEIPALKAFGAGKGLCELIVGAAGFDDVIQRLPQSRAHYIGCGSRIEDEAVLDPDHLNLILDALDEAYDHIVVTGKYEDARDLFEAIQGRFDAGILVGEAGHKAEAAPGVFLGFEVSDIDIIRLEKTQREAPSPASRPSAAPAAPPVAADRLQRATRKGVPQIRAAS